MTYETNPMTLNALQVPDGQKYLRHPVGGGLYLFIRAGSKSWRWDFRLNGKRDTVSLGTFPLASFKKAKILLADAKALQKRGINPRADKKRIKNENLAIDKALKAQEFTASRTLEMIGNAWFETARLGWADSHANKQMQRLNKHLYPKLGHVPITDLTRKQVVDAMLLICETSSPDIGKRVAQMCRQILNNACDKGLIDAVPMGTLNKVLPKVNSKKLPCIEARARLSEYIRAIHNDESGTYVVIMAMKMFSYLGVRCGEFRQARWDEISFSTSTWTIPANHRKLKKTKKEDINNSHLVPLSNQVLKLLKELQAITGQGRHIFPSVRGDSRPMSEAAINTRIAALGFRGEMVSHSWRTVFSTYMNGKGRNRDAIEKQLAHVGRDKVRAAYNRQEYQSDRVSMMQEYADYLDGLRDGADVIPINRIA